MPPKMAWPARNAGGADNVKVVFRVVHVEKPEFVPKIYEKPVLEEKVYEVPRIKYVDKVIEVPVDRIIYRDVVVDRPIFKDITVERITYKDVIIERPVFVDREVNVPKVVVKEEVNIVKREISVDADRVTFTPRVVEVPQFKPVPMKFTCPKCGVMEVK